MAASVDIKAILGQYPHLPAVQAVAALGSAGGFSGAAFWRIDTAESRLCLRQWPQEHPTRERLEYIHAVLLATAGSGPDVLPIPWQTRTGTSFVLHAGHLWELTPWLPGRADYHQRPRRPRLAAAMSTLARFHRAAATFRSGRSEPAFSPGIRARKQQLDGLLAERAARIETNLANAKWPEFQHAARRTLSLFRCAAPAVNRRLNSALQLSVPLQPCIRDIWHDHVLFTGDEVTGIVDFGAMRVETIAADIARLLGSLVEDDSEAWRFGLDAYQRVRRLGQDERDLVATFDASTILLSGMNWLEWICLDGRRFDDPGRVLNRLAENQRRLEQLARDASTRFSIDTLL